MIIQRRISTIRKLAAIGIMTAMAVTALALPSQAVPTSGTGNSQTIAQPVDSASAIGGDDVVVIAFQQNWRSVARQCTQVYGPEGVGHVQVSPPQESVVGSQWWTSYQPASYRLDSKLGSEEEFKTMIATCRAAGVGVIADAVINHMAGTFTGGGTRRGTAGSEYDGDGSFPAVPYEEGDFHACKTNVDDYANADNVQNCRLTGLQDLDTSKPYVQEKLADYLNHLLNLGVEGFRVDAVKHVATQDVKAIKARLAQKSGRPADEIFFEQEVIGGASEAAQTQPANYLDNGKVSEFNFTNHLSVAFSGDITDEARGLSKVGGAGWVPSDKAAVFVTNWDTERSNALTYKKGSRYLLANAFMLAYGYGQPHVYSGYYFDDKDSGAPGATETSVPDVQCPADGSMRSGTWQCAERWTAIRGMIGFHRAVAGTDMRDWKNYDRNVLGFSRGRSGYLAINNGDAPSSQTFHTSLPAGTYCNVYASGDCSDTVAVDGSGLMTATVPARSALAVHTGATREGWTGTSRDDPADPDLSRFDQGARPATDTGRTIYYMPSGDWPSVTMRYTIDGWATFRDLAMKDAGHGWKRADVDPKGGRFEYVFSDGLGHWDNPSGGGNYTAGGHWTTVDGHRATPGIPEELRPYHPRTRVVVHYKPADEMKRGIYMWGTDKDGNAIAGAHHAFTGEDGWGQVFDTTLDGAYDAGKIGFIVTDAQWNKVGGDRSLNASDGTAEVWVDGSHPDRTLSQAPAGQAKTPSSVDVTIHYHRPADDYASGDGSKAWDVWGWSDSANGAAHPFSAHDGYGLIARYHVNGSSPSFKIRYGGDAWEASDPDVDRSIPQTAMTMRADGTASAEIWLVQGDPTVYTNGSLLVTRKSITRADMSAFRTISVMLNAPAEGIDAGDVQLTDEGAGGPAVTAVRVDGNLLTVTTADDLDVTKPYKVKVAGFGSAVIHLGAVVRSDEFDRRFAYTGDDLGARTHGERTVIKVWAPTAVQVALNVYAALDNTAPADGRPLAMAPSERGVWSATVDKTDFAYDFTLTFADGTVNQSVDPYARASTVNGLRSVALQDRDTEVEGSDKRMKPFGPATDAVIAETDIRDFSIRPDSGVSAERRGRYLGMVQTGTKTDKGAVSGLDYVKRLGITHVQIMPMYDYGSVDETGDLSYDPQNTHGTTGAQNWGYDPVNYNVPEGSYSSDPTRPQVRIKEVKQMVKGLHDQGIRVIMDVVYNHVQDPSSHAFERTVPGYYFRRDREGNLVNNSGVGNDTASERAMMRKYIVDSVTYWAGNYNLDGFRFDLMGLLDLETMKEVRAALDKIDPSIIVLGEGWDMNTTMDKARMTIQANAHELSPARGDNGVAFFNDSIRDALKGSVFDDRSTGFISGDVDAPGHEGRERLIARNLMACSSGGGEEAGGTACSAGARYGSPGQVVQYAEIHDNLTLYDKLVKSLPRRQGQDEEEYRQEIRARARLADSVVMLSQGMPAIQLGQEFLRTKGGDGNSYRSGDAVNAIDWDRSQQEGDTVAYMRGLVALRRRIPALRLSAYGQIARQMTVIRQDHGVVAYRLEDGDHTYVVVINANEEATRVTQVPAGEYTRLVSEGRVLALPAGEGALPQASPSARAAGDRLSELVGAEGYMAPALSATVLKAGAPDPGDEPIEPGDGGDPGHPGGGGEPGDGGDPSHSGGGTSPGDDHQGDKPQTGGSHASGPHSSSDPVPGRGRGRDGDAGHREDPVHDGPLPSTGTSIAVPILFALLAVVGGVVLLSPRISSIRMMRH